MKTSPLLFVLVLFAGTTAHAIEPQEDLEADVQDAQDEAYAAHEQADTNFDILMLLLLGGAGCGAAYAIQKNQAIAS